MEDVVVRSARRTDSSPGMEKRDGAWQASGPIWLGADAGFAAASSATSTRLRRGSVTEGARSGGRTEGFPAKAPIFSLNKFRIAISWVFDDFSPVGAFAEVFAFDLTVRATLSLALALAFARADVFAATFNLALRLDFDRAFTSARAFTL